MGILDVFRSGGHPRTSAVILAAGAGSRFSDVAGQKQNTLLRGMPVVARTIAAFESCPLVDEIVIVCREEDVPSYSTFPDKYGFGKIKKIIPGGAERMDSAMAGVDAINDKAKFIAVHDGARCLITPEMIEKTLCAAYKDGAAAAGRPSTDTVKYTEDGRTISETVDRTKVWLIGTPQVFMANMYRAAIYMAKKDGAAVTDDCMMAERLGFKVSLVDVGGENIKITNPEDIYIAEGILRRREDMGR